MANWNVPYLRGVKDALFSSPADCFLGREDEAGRVCAGGWGREEEG